MALKLKDLLGDAYKDGMTAAEIEAALASVDLPENEAQKKEIERLTQALSKSNAEAAENKRKLREKQTEEEQAKEAQEQELTSLREQVANLEKEKLLNGNKLQLVALGYDDALASETAQAMVDGDTAKIFANQKKFLEKQRSQIKDELMRKTPTPPPGPNGETLTREQYRAMSLADKQKLANENPTLYKKMNTEE